jgi:hypothetical protein
MKQMNSRRRLVIAGLLCGTGQLRAADEDVGTSTSELRVAPPPNQPSSSRLQGEYVINNPTGFNIGYSVRWGDGGWVNHTLSARHLRRHWHFLDVNGQAPRPQLKFDNVANDNRVTDKVYHMQFGRVGMTPKGPVNQAVHYEFIAHGNVIDIVRR